MFGEATELIPLSFECPEEEFFHVLAELQAYWQNLLEQVREHGQDIKFLTEIAARAEWSIEETQNPFAPKIGNFHFRASTIEEWLEFRYLDAATYYGDDFKRLRTCANPACGKKFLFNRPKQKFCRDACRHHFNNRIKIESGYLARHQKKGREEKPEIYLLK
ncbi:MAG: hypothetical protein PHI97_15835 [Desulfobulbus sp.]|nr:hypothetical protein [Desulfobulbus sp.]